MSAFVRTWTVAVAGIGLIGSVLAGMTGGRPAAAAPSAAAPQPIQAAFAQPFQVAGARPTSVRASTATAVKVDPRRTFQTIEGWGTSLAWWAESTGGWSSTKDKERLADAIFSKRGLGLNVVRYDIGATAVGDICANLLYRERTGAAVPSFEPLPGVYRWSRDPNQRWMLERAKKDGANRFEAIAYSAPSWMTLDQCSAGALGGVFAGAENLNPVFYTAYARYLAAVVRHFHDAWGITFETVDPFNEPVQTKWTPTRAPGQGPPIQQGMNVGYRTQNIILARLKASLAENGASAYTAISAPDEQSLDGAVEDYKHYTAASRASVAQLNAHDYQDQQNGDKLYELARQAGRPVWMSEWGGNGSTVDPMGSAIVLARHINTNERQLHPTAWSIWQAADGGTKQPDDGNCDDLWGLVCTNIEQKGPAPIGIRFPKRYYAMGQYSKFVRPGYRMVSNTDPDTFTAYDERSHSLVIVATNEGRSAKSVSYDLSGFAAGGGIAAPHRTDLNENLRKQPDIPVVSGRFSDSLPPRSITTYVVKSTGSGGGSPFGRLAPVQYGQDMYVFGRGTNQHAFVDAWVKGVGWSGWTDLGGHLASSPVAVVFRNQVQVFAVSTDGRAYANVRTEGKGWSGWQSLGGNLLGGVSAVPFGQQLQVLGVGTDGSAYQKVWDPGGGWSGWRDLGGHFTSGLVGVQFGGQLQVFGVGTNAHAYLKVWDPRTGWTGWRDLGGQLVGNVSALRFGRQMQVFGRAANGRTYQDVWDPATGWSGWRDLGGQLVGEVSAVQFDKDLYVFGRASNGHAFVRVWVDGVGWSGWRDLGGHLSGDVSGVRFGVQVQAFAQGDDGHGYSDVGTDGSWRGWQDLGGHFT